MKTFSRVRRLAFVLLFIPVVAFSQSTLRGSVTDSTTRGIIVGANVVLLGSSLGCATDIEGVYVINGIPQKSFKVKVSCVGYEPKEIEINFSEKKTVVLNVQLQPAIIMGVEVIVTAQLRGQLAAMNQQITSKTIMNVVSEEKIQELPDANAAEAIGRLPGVSIIRSGGEATNIVLRGLSSQFSNITVDGVKVPPTDPSTRDVDLSMLSQGALAGVELHKTLTADQDADAIAGSVNLVTRKAPSERLLRFDIKGDYNVLMKSSKQYDLSFRYGERFFNDLLGIQLQGNAESKIRSRENDAYGYTPSNNTDSLYNIRFPMREGNSTIFGNDYSLSSFDVRFTDELRNRNGGQVIFDLNTPDSGSVKLTGLYSETGRNITLNEREYPAGSGTAEYLYQYTEQRISTLNGSLQGTNHVLGLTVDWNAAYAQSRIKNPFDYRMAFIADSAGSFQRCKDHPEINIIPFANNNFSAVELDSTNYMRRENFDKEQTLQLNVSKIFNLGNFVSNEFKIGGKYKAKTRWYNTGDMVWNNYKQYPLVNVDGSPIDLTGTRFEGIAHSAVPLIWYLDQPVVSRNVMGLYHISPLINVDAMKEWWDLNKNGKAAVAQDWGPNGNSVLSDYYITENISSAYIMNTLDIGQMTTFIFGLRVEKESNDYKAKYSDGAVGGTGAVVTLNGQVIDTTAHYAETIWLPSAQLSVRPTDYLTVRFAAYRALARPAFDMRLPQFAPGSGNAVFSAGNPQLKDAKAWNFEVNTQIYSNTIGLFSVSGFYKIIDDLFHQTNNVLISWPSGGPNTAVGYKGWTTSEKAGLYGRLDRLLDDLNMSSWEQNPTFASLLHTSPVYSVNLAYNSPDPSYAWGIEVEHQMNFGFLPVSWLRNVVLSYNFSITRSQTNIIIGRTVEDTTYTPPSGTPGTPRYKPEKYNYLQNSEPVLVTRNSENQPEIYGNVALGYDIGDFSARLSVYYQGRYTSQYSAFGTSDGIVDEFTKWDLALKQQVTSNIALFLNVNNIFNKEETRSRLNNVFDWGYLPRTAELYGTSVDLAVRVLL